MLRAQRQTGRCAIVPEKASACAVGVRRYYTAQVQRSFSSCSSNSASVSPPLLLHLRTASRRSAALPRLRRLTPFPAWLAHGWERWNAVTLTAAATAVKPRYSSHIVTIEDKDVAKRDEGERGQQGEKARVSCHSCRPRPCAAPSQYRT